MDSDSLITVNPQYSKKQSKHFLIKGVNQDNFAQTLKTIEAFTNAGGKLSFGLIAHVLEDFGCEVVESEAEFGTKDQPMPKVCEVAVSAEGDILAYQSMGYIPFQRQLSGSDAGSKALVLTSNGLVSREADGEVEVIEAIGVIKHKSPLLDQG